MAAPGGGGVENQVGSGRRLAIRIVAVLGTILFASFFSIVAADVIGAIEPAAVGSPDDPPPSPEARFGAAHPGEAVHAVGAFSVLALGASGLVALIVRPERSRSAYQVLAAMLGVLVTLPLVGDPNNVGGQAGVIDPLLLVLVVPAIAAAAIATPWRSRSSGMARPRLLALAGVAALPAAWYCVDQALLQRDTFPPTADPHHNAHWWVMAVAAAMAVFVLAGDALPSRGRPWGSLVAGAAAVAFGAASMLAPSAASAVPSGWAIASVLWGLATAWLALRTDTDRAGRPEASPPPP